MTIAIVKSAKWHMQICICHLKWCDGERMNSTERDIKQIKGGMIYLVQQLAA